MYLCLNLIFNGFISNTFWLRILIIMSSVLLKNCDYEESIRFYIQYLIINTLYYEKTSTSQIQRNEYFIKVLNYTVGTITNETEQIYDKSYTL